MKYDIIKEGLSSRRGNYNLVILTQNPLVFIPEPLDLSKTRHQAVIAEVWQAVLKKLRYHPYWENEPLEFVKYYEDFYNELFSLEWLHRPQDRHNIVVNKNCCLTMVQYHLGKLIAYSRSTDMRNGYFSDKLILRYLAETINRNRPDCKVDIIEWHLAIPHVYEEKGIARLLDKENY